LSPSPSWWRTNLAATNAETGDPIVPLPVTADWQSRNRCATLLYDVPGKDKPRSCKSSVDGRPHGQNMVETWPTDGERYPSASSMHSQWDECKSQESHASCVRRTTDHCCPMEYNRRNSWSGGDAKRRSLRRDETGGSPRLAEYRHEAVLCNRLVMKSSYEIMFIAAESKQNQYWVTNEVSCHCGLMTAALFRKFRQYINMTTATFDCKLSNPSALLCRPVSLTLV
jgi:hypothetical protein